MAEIATSRTNSSTRTRWPSARAVMMRMPRLHQFSPTSELNPTAISTPATTAMIRRNPLVRVAKRVTWTMSSAVSGASSGGGLLPSSQTAAA